MVGVSVRIASLLPIVLMFALGGAPAALARVSIAINLSSQTMHVTSGEGESYDWAVSTGRSGHLTPSGTFVPQRLMVMTYSIPYNHAPMPHSIFFSGGYAIHGTYEVGALGRPASHGCVRLAPGNAALLFDMVRREGATISIFHGANAAATAASWHSGRARIVTLRPRGGMDATPGNGDPYSDALQPSESWKIETIGE